jgi:hypothetical protein
MVADGNFHDDDGYIGVVAVSNAEPSVGLAAEWDL